MGDVKVEGLPFWGKCPQEDLRETWKHPRTTLESLRSLAGSEYPLGCGGESRGVPGHTALFARVALLRSCGWVRPPYIPKQAEVRSKTPELRQIKGVWSASAECLGCSSLHYLTPAATPLCSQRAAVVGADPARPGSPRSPRYPLLPGLSLSASRYKAWESQARQIRSQFQPVPTERSYQDGTCRMEYFKLYLSPDQGRPIAAPSLRCGGGAGREVAGLSRSRAPSHSPSGSRDPPPSGARTPWVPKSRRGGPARRQRLDYGALGTPRGGRGAG